MLDPRKDCSSSDQTTRTLHPTASCPDWHSVPSSLTRFRSATISSLSCEWGGNALTSRYDAAPLVRQARHARRTGATSARLSATFSYLTLQGFERRHHQAFFLRHLLPNFRGCTSSGSSVVVHACDMRRVEERERVSACEARAGCSRTHS